MATKTLTKEVEETNKLILEKTDVETTTLSVSDTAEIEAVFNEAEDFRSIGEKSQLLLIRLLVRQLK